MTDRDTIVLGAGLDGLAAAATLARAGRKTLVLDEREFAGGRAARAEFHPGYTAPGLVPDDGGLRRELFADLALEQHGLTWRAAPPAVYGADGLCLAADGVRGLSPGDAGDAGDTAALAAWRAFAARVAPLIGRLLDRPVPPGSKPELSEALSLARTALGLRLLPEREFYELQRVATLAVSDWLEEHFAAPALRALLAAPALAGSHVGPRAAGTALPRLVRESLAQGSRGHGGVEGGPAALADALEKAARAAGAELRLGTGTGSLLVEDGRVTGVRLADGEQLESRDVLSTLGVTRTFLELVPRGSLSVSAGQTARHWRTRGDTSVVRLALSDTPRLAGAEGPAERFVTAEDTLVQERAADALKYGQLPERVWLDGWMPTLTTPSLAPAGHHVLVLAVHGTPHDVSGGWSETTRAQLEERVEAELERAAPGANELVVGKQLLTPTDLERHYALPGGHLQRGETTLDQLYLLRPGLAFSRYGTELGGLWLGGADAHPGGLAAAGAGVLGARALLAGETERDPPDEP